MFLHENEFLNFNKAGQFTIKFCLKYKWIKLLLINAPSKVLFSKEK